jgi:hypothetical protein
MAFQLSIERTAADPEEPGGDRFVTAHLLQRAHDVLPLDFDEWRRAVDLSGSARRRREVLLAHDAAELRLSDEFTVCEDACALQDIPQLANIAIPRRLCQQAFGWRCQAEERLSKPLREVLHEGSSQIRNVLTTLPQ